MKKILLMLLITLLLVPTLANASFFGISWYKDYKVEKNISESIVAGSTDTIIVSFKNPTPFIGTLIAVLNVEENSGNNPVWLGDFKVRAELNSTSLYEPNISNSYSTDCTELENGIFYCFNLSEMNCTPIGKKFMICLPILKPEGSFIVLPGSKNNLTLYVTFNPALIPSNYSFNITLYNDILIPLIEDPISNSTKANSSTLFNASLSDTLLWITTSEDKNLSVDVTLFQYFLEKTFIPEGLTPIKFVGIEANDTEDITLIEIWVYYKDDEIPSWVDENSLRLYYYDTSSNNPDEWKWKLLDSGVNTRENYVWAKTNHLSLFGIFGSPSIKKEVVYVSGPTIYLPGRTRYRNVTQNITLPAKAVCGNGICEAKETCSNCPEDCKCPDGYECKNGVCVALPPTKVCGNGICELGENHTNCPADCLAPKVSPTHPQSTPPTGYAVSANITFFSGIAGGITVILLGILFYRRFKKKK